MGSEVCIRGRAQIEHAGQFFDNLLERGSVDLGIERGQYQGDGAIAPVANQFTFQAREVGFTESVQGGDHPALVEVSHGQDIRTRPLRVSSERFCDP